MLGDVVHRLRSRNRLARKRGDRCLCSRKTRLGALRRDIGRLDLGCLVRKPRALGHKPRRARLVFPMHHDFRHGGLACKAFGAYAAVPDALGDIEHDGHSRGICVCRLVVRHEAMREYHHHRNGDQKHADTDDDVEDNRRRSLGMQEKQATNDENNRNQHHSAERRPLDGWDGVAQPGVELRAHLSAVVARDEHHFAPARAASSRRVARIVLGDDVLAHPMRHQPRDDWAAQHLEHEENRRDDGEDDRRNERDRKEQRHPCGNECEEIADRTRNLGVRGAAEILDHGRQARLFLELLGYVERCLLLFFSAGGPRPYFLRQIRNVVHQFWHTCCLSLAFARICMWAYML